MDQPVPTKRAGSAATLTLNRAHPRLSTATDSLFSEREFAQITLDSIGDAVLCTDARGHVAYLNPVRARLTGYQIDQARGRPLAEVFNAVDGATRPSVCLRTRCWSVATEPRSPSRTRRRPSTIKVARSSVSSSRSATSRA